MARPLRFQYPGAVYHLMARGDGGKTTVSNGRIAGRLAMGHPGAVSRLVSASRKDPDLSLKRNELETLLYGNKSNLQRVKI